MPLRIPAHDPQDNDNIFERLGIVEVVVEDLKIGLTTLNTKMSAVLEAVNASRSTDWKTLASWTAVMLTAMGMLAAVLVVFVRMSIAPVETSARNNESTIHNTLGSYDELQEQFQNHQQLPVHPVAAERLDQIQAQLDELRSIFKLVLIAHEKPGACAHE